MLKPGAVWKNKQTGKQCVIEREVKMSSMIEGKWFSGILYKIDGEYQVRIKDDFLAKFSEVKDGQGNISRD